MGAWSCIKKYTHSKVTELIREIYAHTRPALIRATDRSNDHKRSLLAVMPSFTETEHRWSSRMGPSAGTDFVLHVVKPFLICPIILFCFFLLSAHPSWSKVTTDEYIAGFAAAIIQHEIKAADSTLQVHNGVVRISAQSLGGRNREKVKRALAGIAGVKDVVIIENEEPQASPPPQRGVLVDIPETESSFLPRGLLFAPLHADPRWPHFSAA